MAVIAPFHRHMSTLEMAEMPTILNAAIACRDSFRAATKVPRLMQQEWAENRRADFNLWTAGAGASKTGKISLDHRLQANPETHTIIVNMLCMLRVLVEKCIDEAHSTEQNAAELSSGEIARMKDVEDSLSQLSRLTFAIRKAGIRSRLQKADGSFDPENSQISSLRRHLEVLLLAYPDEYGSSELSRNQLNTARLTPVQLRLIEANLKRRNRFLYAQRHAQKLGNNSVKKNSIPSSTAVLVKQQQPNSGTGIKATLSPPESTLEDNPGAQSTTTATMVDEQILVPPKTANPTTVVSVTTSRISYPQPPPIHDDQKVFTCPCCCQSLPTTVAQGSHWKKHLMGDILPYTCIFQECFQAGIFYNTKETWLRHIEKEHGGAEQWVCQACSQKNINATFRESADFTVHLEQEHNRIKPQQIPMLHSAWRRKVAFKISACPICRFEDDDQNAVLDHVAEHIHSFSLRSLPWAPREGPEEGNDDEEYNNYFKQHPYFDVDSSRSGFSSSATNTGSFARFDHRESQSNKGLQGQHEERAENPFDQGLDEVSVQAATSEWLAKLSDAAPAATDDRRASLSSPQASSSPWTDTLPSQWADSLDDTDMEELKQERRPSDSVTVFEPENPHSDLGHLVDRTQLLSADVILPEKSWQEVGCQDTIDLLHITGINHKIRPQIIAVIHGKVAKKDDKLIYDPKDHFDVSCGFSLYPRNRNAAAYFVQAADGRHEYFESFAMTVSASFHGPESKDFELVRDIRGRRAVKPEMVVLQPQPFQDPLGLGSSRNTENPLEHSNPIAPSNLPTIHTFELIRLKNVTGDIGSQERYFNLEVGLYAKVVDSEGQSQHLKIATRMSASMVLR